MIPFFAVFAICAATTTAVFLCARPLVDRGRPSTVVPLLAVGSLISAASIGLLLSLLGVSVLARVPFVAEVGHWSAALLEVAVPVPVVIGAVAGTIAVFFLARTLWRTVGIAVQLVRADRLSRRLRGSGGPIALIDTADADADAFAVAGVKGCVVISRQLFDALGPAERKMLTAHELSHLEHRHHLYVHAADIAAAANPALTRVSAAMRLGVERWADEDAAAITGNRNAAAAALANTALIRSGLRRTSFAFEPSAVGLPVLCIAASDIGKRARALLAPAPHRSMLTLGISILLIATCAATVGSTLQFHDGFEHSETNCHHRAA